jgi:Rps23 Pro-64 3,4-dihydroxylase Tpa1-like proline 4-hydroxylase
MKELENIILSRLDGDIKAFTNGYFKYWIVDDLLPIELAQTIARAFPSEDVLRQRDSLREYKRVGINFDEYDPIMEDITYVFHNDQIVKKVENITGFSQLSPDRELYAGGLSSMVKNSFLNPHLDNSHNDSKTLYRVLNLLYYVSEARNPEDGGNLLLFPKGIDQPSVLIESTFNRLVIMETNDQSYHGVTKVISETPRRCISNYYFSMKPTVKHDYLHVTSFFPFPEDRKFKVIALFLDRNIRQHISKIYKGIFRYKNWHKRS